MQLASWLLATLFSWDGSCRNWALLAPAASWAMQQQHLMAAQRSPGHTKEAHCSSGQSQCEPSTQLPNAAEKWGIFTVWDRDLLGCLILSRRWKELSYGLDETPLSSRSVLECLCQALLTSTTGDHCMLSPNSQQSANTSVSYVLYYQREVADKKIIWYSAMCIHSRGSPLTFRHFCDFNLQTWIWNEITTKFSNMMAVNLAAKKVFRHKNKCLLLWGAKYQ